jgi:guanosine-3',5'-bis(diphosphate) 3'-pyrophosphohydrolase
MMNPTAGSISAGISTRTTRTGFPARILVTAINAPGTLAEVSQAIATSETNIQNLTMVRVAADFTEMLIDLQVWDLKHLNQLITQLKELGSVSTVERIYQ